MALASFSLARALAATRPALAPISLVADLHPWQNDIRPAKKIAATASMNR